MTSVITLRDPVAHDDFVCRRMIVCDAETINGIGGGIVGRRYLGVPRAIVSVYFQDRYEMGMKRYKAG